MQLFGLIGYRSVAALGIKEHFREVEFLRSTEVY